MKTQEKCGITSEKVKVCICMDVLLLLKVSRGLLCNVMEK